jgi:hypothetical protein
LAILWISPAAQRQCALAGDILELGCDVQADIDRPQYFAAILANRTPIAHGTPNRSISMQAKSIRHMMRVSCMCCQKSFRNRIKCVQKCKRALNLSTISSRAKLVSAARRSQGEGFARPV